MSCMENSALWVLVGFKSMIWTGTVFMAKHPYGEWSTHKQPGWSRDWKLEKSIECGIWCETFLWVLYRGMEMEWKSSFQKEQPTGTRAQSLGSVESTGNNNELPGCSVKGMLGGVVKHELGEDGERGRPGGAPLRQLATELRFYGL